MLNKNNKAQVWVETVIYTLIGLVLIGVVLAVATPAIQKQKDKSTIERTIDTMNELDRNILGVKGAGVANTREMSFSIGKGNLIVNSSNDKIIFQIDESSYQYSEAGKSVEIPGTNQEVLTQKKGKKYLITLSLDYRQKINITFNSKDEAKTLTQASTPYVILVENNGIPNLESLVNIDIYTTS
ncbi:hypothetical protein J4466_02200 [Candidatus Pacearchaeota archaeon]|nr:hypothetical protein [Candidatus Pacearchaeota archaeon]